MKVALLGYGVEGKSAYKYFRSQELGHGSWHITICDSSTDIEVPAGTEAKLGPDYLKGLDEYDLVVRSPGIHPRELKGAKQVTSGTKEFFAHCPAPIIGVTGTKGKGTTATLIAKILEAAGHRVWLGGNVGTPALDFLDQIQPEDKVVLELSSFQLIDLTQSPHIGVLLMIAPEHLNYHTDFAEYVEAKGNILRYQSAGDLAVFNAQNEYSVQLAEKTEAHKVPYGNKTGAYVENGKIYFQDTEICSIGEVGLIGAHNLENVCAAVAATWVTQNPAVMREVIRSFEGLPHRLEFVGEHAGVKYYDDSISTTPESTIAAIKAFTEPKVVILGGSDKGAAWEELAEAVSAGNVEGVIILGETGPEIARALDGVGYKDYKRGLTDMDSAVAAAKAMAGAGSVVLLSPACASFGLFRDYKDRGDQFQEAVKSL